jgi:hypothetical protein
VTPDVERLPQHVAFRDTAAFTETYGFAGNSGMVNLEGQLLRPRGVPSSTVYLFMHPTSTLNLLPMPRALVGAGLHVLCAASRYPKNDAALIMEKVAGSTMPATRWAMPGWCWSAGRAAARSRSSIRRRRRPPPSWRRPRATRWT